MFFRLCWGKVSFATMSSTNSYYIELTISKRGGFFNIIDCLLFLFIVLVHISFNYFTIGGWNKALPLCLRLIWRVIVLVNI